MRLLIIGGTRFLGRHLVEDATERGHHVTLFNRGRTNPELFPGVERIRGDRESELDALKDGRWDAVVDTCGYVPRVVGASARALAGRVGLYVFISSISVHGDFSRPVSEDSPLATIEDESTEEVTGESYGPLKALSERAVEDAVPGRALIVRPGLIVGPHDTTVRFSYWTARVARGGEVLAPGEPSRHVQFIDARDLAAWTLRMTEAGRAGVFDATGPDEPLTMGEFLDACRDVSRSDARFTWVDEQFLIERGVAPWSELPLWLPESNEQFRYFSKVDVGRALAEGLTFRPLSETVRDTLAWQSGLPGSQPSIEKDGVPVPDATLKPERERELLDEWHAEKRA